VIADVIDILFGVWTPAVLVSAAMTGGGVGYIAVGAIIRNPLFSSGLASPSQNAALVTIVAMLGGGAFWIGQVIGSLADGDPLWPRVLSRFTVWLVFAGCLGIGAYFAARRDQARRTARARAKALLERGRLNGQ
jgi:hypothetical protein